MTTLLFLLFSYSHFSAQDYYIEGGPCIEMLHFLDSKFHPVDSTKRHTLIAKLLSTTLPDDMELREFFYLLKDTSMQLGRCGKWCAR